MPNLDLSIVKIMHGDVPVLRIMEGDTKIWPSGTDVIVDGTLTNVTSSVSLPATVALSGSFTATLTANTSCVLNQVEVIMGGVDITSTAYNEGVITIASVTGDIVITASAVEVITFEDANVKTICVENWGGNVIQGEITPTEAAAVTSFASKFKGNTTITKFNEGVYFSKVTTFEAQFQGCTYLTHFTAGECTLVARGVYQAFRGCSRLQYIDLSRANAAAVNNLYYCFYDCNQLKVFKMPEMFGQSVTSGMRFTWGDRPTNRILISGSFAVSSAWTANFNNMNFAGFARLLIKNLGSSNLAIDLSANQNWGVDQEITIGNETFTTTDALQSMVDSLLTYSVDRAAANLSTITIKLHANAKARLTAEQISAIEAKGYTITT